MDGPIVSIFDMLKKRYRQQKKEELMQSETFPVDGRRPNFPARGTEVKKLKLKASRSKIAGTPKEKSSKGSSNMVTATHLTKKRSALIIPTVANKEVLNELIERMTMPAKKSDEKLIISHGSSSSTESAFNTVVSTQKKPKATVSSKSKIAKPTSYSASNSSRRRLALSPRNTNSLATPKPKREKSLKSKTARKGDGNDSASGLRSKRRLPSAKSKVSIHTKAELKPDDSEDNRLRYRL
ncbi:hypothetical protein KR093_010912 [Drosophila rubida]|uniref:Uncharacterized protein n=1 Tax=Drosophila rubida TaxID=30044 RepID=A0AAD4K749_9MUSC|nr:hypothetical protein KR093_010912 [Drosophila rubida]